MPESTRLLAWEWCSCLQKARKPSLGEHSWPGNYSSESIPGQETTPLRISLARQLLGGEYLFGKPCLGEMDGSLESIRPVWERIPGQGSASLESIRPVWRVFGQFSTILLASGLLCFPLRSFMKDFCDPKNNNRGPSAPRNDCDC